MAAVVSHRLHQQQQLVAGAGAVMLSWPVVQTSFGTIP